MYQIVYAKAALNDIAKLKAAHLEAKAKNLIAVVSQNPYQIPPPYEKLVGDLSGVYSRRINIKHRLLYTVHEQEQVVKILRMWTHYE